MESVLLTIAAGDLLQRVRQRLSGLNSSGRQVVWRCGQHAVLIHAGRAQARLLHGWLVVGLELETEQTGRCSLELVYFLGSRKDGDGPTAAVRINAATREAVMLAEICGDDLQRVIWDAVLDAIQLALQSARRQFPREQLVLRGFTVLPEGIEVRVAAGEF